MKNRFSGSSEEIVEAATKGVVSMIPVVGGLLAELGAVLVNPLDTRKRAWIKEVEKALTELSEKHQRLPDALVDDPAFVTAFLKATAAALATHHEIKIQALREFIVAVGAKSVPDEELQHALLRLLEDLSVGHIEVLLFLKKDNTVPGDKKGRGLEGVFGRYRHNGKLGRMAFRWIISDLTARMIIHLGDLEDMNEFASQRSALLLEDSGERPLQITALGHHFLKLLVDRTR